MTKGKKPFQPLTSESICKLYDLLLEQGLVAFDRTEEGRHKIEALVANITGASFGVEHYPNHEEKTVTYLYFIINAHAFTDGNKRTACLTFLVLCDINDLSPKIDSFILDEVAVFLERASEADHHKLIRDVAKLLFV